MKRLTATYTIDFEDDTPDKTCYQVMNEIMGQDRHWPDDNQVKIETIPDVTPDPTRPE